MEGGGLFLWLMSSNFVDDISFYRQIRLFHLFTFYEKYEMKHFIIYLDQYLGDDLQKKIPRVLFLA